MSKNILSLAFVSCVAWFGMGVVSANVAEAYSPRCNKTCRPLCFTTYKQKCRPGRFGRVCRNVPKVRCVKRCEVRCIQPVKVCRRVLTQGTSCRWEKRPRTICHDRLVHRWVKRTIIKKKRVCHPVRRWRCKWVTIKKRVMRRVPRTKRVCHTQLVSRRVCRTRPLAHRQCHIERRVSMKVQKFPLRSLGFKCMWLRKQAKKAKAVYRTSGTYRSLHQYKQARRLYKKCRIKQMLASGHRF